MMGSFEKLGILVIVVIIVMILAVAIYQWGATGIDSGTTVLPISQTPEPLVIDYDDPEPNTPKSAAKKPGPGMWTGGIPKTYVIQNHDIVWKLVVKVWRLKDTFIEAIKSSNPSLNMKRLRAGDKLVIPNPASYARKKSKSKTPKKGISNKRGVEYKIRDGDRLESIAAKRLGSRSRWKEIQALNPGLDPNNLGLGDTILLPAK